MAKTKIWSESRSEPGLHIKRTSKVKDGSNSIGTAVPGTSRILGDSLIVLGKRNRGTSKLDGMTK